MQSFNGAREVVLNKAKVQQTNKENFKSKTAVALMNKKRSIYAAQDKIKGVKKKMNKIKNENMKVISKSL